jgi:hypothetical protein
MHYSFPQNKVNSVQSSPEYEEIREILQHMVADMQRIIELVWEIFGRGNVFNNCKCNSIPCVLYRHE